jgi:putative flippase GtrA
MSSDNVIYKTWRAIIDKIENTTILRYMIVGGTSYAVELSSLLAIYHFGHTSREVATAIAYWIGLCLAFVLQKLVAFKDYRKEAKALSRQGFTYAILTLWNYGFTILVVSLFSGKYVIMSRTLAQVTFSCWNYFIYKKIIFKKEIKVAV